jgi:hypothetical protein
VKRTAVAVVGVERIDARGVSATRTGGLAAGTILLLIAAAGIAATATLGSFGASDRITLSGEMVAARRK